MAATYHPLSHGDATFELASTTYHDEDHTSMHENSQAFMDLDGDNLDEHDHNATVVSPVRSEKSGTRRSIPRKALHQNSVSQTPLVHATPQPLTYSLEKYIGRSLLNTVGPCLFLAFYLFIGVVYILRPPVNDIVPGYPIKGKGVFFAWLVLSIFVLDWAKSGLAGLEAWALMNPRYAPKTAAELLWHADRSWGSVSGWWRAFKVLFNNLCHILPGRFGAERKNGPGRLWWYLTLSSFAIYAAVPLAGLSMDPSDALTYDHRSVSISGPNVTFFDFNDSNGMALKARNRWTLGLATTPEYPSVLYGPQGKTNGSSTYFQDVLTDAYHRDINATTDAGTEATFFTAPQTSERVHGRVWGLKTTSKCAMVHFKDLTMVHVRSISDWNHDSSHLNSTNYNDNDLQMQGEGGSLPLTWTGGSPRGVDYHYLAASNLDPATYFDYRNGSNFPDGILEFVLWQGFDNDTRIDPDWLDMAQSPWVVNNTFTNTVVNGINSTSTWNQTFLGFALQCWVNSSTGVAVLDPRYNSFSNFVEQPAAITPGITAGDDISSYPGIVSMSTLTWAAFTTQVLDVFGPLGCTSGNYAEAYCDPYVSANSATNGNPKLVLDLTTPGLEKAQFPTIRPERFKLAIQKLIGECAIAVMAAGPGDWTGSLGGLKHASAIVPGKVPWQVVLPLLVFWTVITVLPSILVFGQRRWAATLDGPELFKLGAEWTNAVWAFHSQDVEENTSLLDVPGMIGEMNSGKTDASGFLGLSHYPAKRHGTFVYDRSRVMGVHP